METAGPGDTPAGMEVKGYNGTMATEDGADAGGQGGALGGMRSVLVVVAHPDDESFGLGAVLDHLAGLETSITLLCFTRGEVSTLGGWHADLGVLRSAELTAAAEVLGVGRTVLLDYPDGRLGQVPLDRLADHVECVAAEARPTHVLAFDPGGVTGHPDHVRATQAARAAADRLRLPVLGWTLPVRVAQMLNAEFGTALVGSRPQEMDLELVVSRDRQRAAIACHRSQATENPLLYRRLSLLGDREYLRVLPSARTGTRPTYPTG